MSSKVNIFGVVRGHVSTLVDTNTLKHSWPDLLTFYFLPIAMSVLGGYFAVDFSKDSTTLLVTAGAIFTGLLLNLLILVYDQKGKLPPVDSDQPNWSDIQSRHTVIKELYYNISYSTLMSVALVVIAIVHLFVIDKTVNIEYLDIGVIDVSSVSTSPMLIFFGANLVLTIVMIIKRIYTLLSTET